MITPMYEEHESIEDSVRTRISLQSVDAKKHEQRLREFSELPDTLLLFLTKLKKLTIRIYNESALQSTVEYKYHLNETTGIGRLTKQKGSPDSVQETVTDFHVVRRQITNLPYDEKREMTRQAEVVLAFPVDGNEQPVIEQQHVFAFLPVRNVGFSV